MRIYERSKSFIVDADVESAVKEIYAVLRAPKPYRDIPKLPALLDRYNDAYSQVLDAAAKPVLSTIADDRRRVLEVLDEKPYKAKYAASYAARFDELKAKAEQSHDIMELRGCADEADVMRIRLLDEMDRRDAETPQPSTPPVQPGDQPVIPPQPAKPAKRRKNVTIKSLTQTSSWRIESDADIDAYLAALRRRLESELDADTIVNVEF